ncbi:MAG: type II toxin-antitoxin system VapC family toxin [Micropruina sp.]|uniref:type II toxin-antitoxin system VapC family toxin n=1 Tax=Micropruina sp. TaxID=2737536 RepID=UPI0039E32191
MSGRSARTLLLDTCALLDLTIAPDRISSTVLAELSDRSVGLLVSAVTAWEVAIKTRQGKLPGGERLLASWDQTLIDLQATALGIDHADAVRAGGLPWAHRDPFDRMLVAQSARHNIPLVTRDDAIIGARIVPTVDTRA